MKDGCVWQMLSDACLEVLSIVPVLSWIVASTPVSLDAVLDDDHRAALVESLHIDLYL